MGYKRKSKVYVLAFEDEEYEGLEVRVKSVPVGKFLELNSLAMGVSKNGETDAEAAIETNAELLKAFANALVSWNVEDEDSGEPIPSTLEGVNSCDFDFAMRLIEAWLEALAGVSRPLAQEFNSGSTALEESIPMDGS